MLSVVILISHHTNVLMQLFGVLLIGLLWYVHFTTPKPPIADAQQALQSRNKEELPDIYLPLERFELSVFAILILIPSLWLGFYWLMAAVTGHTSAFWLCLPALGFAMLCYATAIHEINREKTREREFLVLKPSGLSLSYDGTQAVLAWRDVLQIGIKRKRIGRYTHRYLVLVGNLTDKCDNANNGNNEMGSRAPQVVQRFTVGLSDFTHQTNELEALITWYMQLSAAASD